MTIPAGTRLGSYEIAATFGAGGMGEVYRATDTQLDRQVAIKVLPQAFLADPERLARFEREAKVLAQLHHPNIASIFGLEAAGGTRALILELVEGPTLEERLAQGGLSFEEILSIARQIAEALEEAHEKGIVHRDLKPANVKVTADGKVKVLDFGLAKALDPVGRAPSASDAARSPTLMNSPTLTAAQGTQLGVILGTAAYMAPEQARGGQVDKRADIWAFGVVLFEMLSSRPLFAGATVSDTLAGVLKTEIDFSALPPSTPAGVRRLLRRCLERNPQNRLHDIADARLELAEEESPAPGAAAVPTRPGRVRALLPWGVALLAIAAATGWVLFVERHETAPPRVLTLAALPPPGTVSSGPIDLSLDGRQLAFTAAGADGRTRLYVRSLDAVVAKALPATEGANAPFFSPDGRALGFFAGGKLKRIDLAGGPPRELADAQDHRGGSWGVGNTIVFAPEGGGPIFRVSAAGGETTPVTALDAVAQETSHRWPRFLPDGRRFFFMSRKPKPPGRLAVEVGSIDGGPRVRLTESNTSGAVARGRLYFERESTLLAQTLDVRTLRLSGDPVAVDEEAWRDPGTDGLTAFAVAADGTLAYRRGGIAQSQLTWLDRQGHRLGTVGSPAPGLGSGGLVLSADDRRVLTDMPPPQRGDAGAVFELEIATGRTTRLTFGPGNQEGGLYSPDQRAVIFGSDSAGPYDLYRQEIGTAGEPSPVLASKAWKFPESWSPDGRHLSFLQSDAGKAGDIWILPLTGEARPFPFVQTPADESGSVFSPDGRFLAYVSDESGRAEVFVRTFPASPAKWQVSVGGGTMPTWRRDGKELFYIDADGWLVAVPVALEPGRFEPGVARPLFRLAGLSRPTTQGSLAYAVTTDGQRFLANLIVGEAESSPIVIQTGDRP